MSAEMVDAKGGMSPPDRAVGFSHTYNLLPDSPGTSVGFPHFQGQKGYPFRHGSINTLFVDGHAAAIPDPGDGNRLPFAVVWVGPDPVDVTWGRLWE